LKFKLLSLTAEIETNLKSYAYTPNSWDESVTLAVDSFGCKGRNSIDTIASALQLEFFYLG
jgi:hypothetical protein